MSEIRVGSRVMIEGFLCEVTGVGDVCDECDGKLLQIIDPEGNADEVHEKDCDGQASR